MVCVILASWEHGDQKTGISCPLDICKKHNEGGYFACSVGNVSESVFKECYRVLKDGRPFVFTFNNKDPKVWMAVMKAALEAGFVLEDDGVIYQEPIENYIHTAHTKYSGALLGDFIYTFLKDKSAKPVLSENTSEENLHKRIGETIDQKICETVKKQPSTTNEIYIEVFRQIIPLLASLAMEQKNFKYTTDLFKNTGIEDKIKKLCTWDDNEKKWRM